MADAMTVPTLWIGTSVGSVFYVMANVPPAGETRLSQPVTLSTVGKLNIIAKRCRFNLQLMSEPSLHRTI